MQTWRGRKRNRFRLQQCSARTRGPARRPAVQPEKTYGAGKTTTVECIEGLRTPVAARSACSGWTRQVIAASRGRAFGVQLQDSQLPELLRVGEALKLYRWSPPGPPIAPSPGRIGPGSIHRTGPYQQDPFLSGSRYIADPYMRPDLGRGLARPTTGRIPDERVHRHPHPEGPA